MPFVPHFALVSLYQDITCCSAGKLRWRSVSAHRGEVHDLRNGDSRRLASRGSRRSRRASPTIFRLKSTSTIANAGPSIIQGSLKIKLRASVIIEPQSGVGGGAPSPRKLSTDSSRIAKEIEMVAWTSSGLKILGKICRIRILVVGVPAQ